MAAPALAGEPRHFASAAAFRRWLERHHASATEIWVGFYNRRSGRGGLTYVEAVEQALCFGWIDGIARNVDHERHAQRFTPRTPRSRWSAINARRFAVLKAAGQVVPAGQAAFDAWDGARAPYAFEHRETTLSPAFRSQFRQHAKAWRWFSAASPGYQRIAIFWVMSARREETRLRRLATLIADSGAGVRIRLLRRDRDPRRVASRRAARVPSEK